MEPREYLDILRRRWFSVLVIALTTLTVASILTLAMPKRYTATTELFFAVAGESVSELAQGSSFAEKQMSSYAKVATSPLVLEPVIGTRVEMARRTGGLPVTAGLHVPEERLAQSYKPRIVLNVPVQISGRGRCDSFQRSERRILCAATPSPASSTLCK